MVSHNTGSMAVTDRVDFYAALTLGRTPNR